MTDSCWRPTHKVTHPDGPYDTTYRGSWVNVMLVRVTEKQGELPSGAAYTRAEWAVRTQSRHYTGLRCVGGQWFHRNKPFQGKVEML